MCASIVVDNAGIICSIEYRFIIEAYLKELHFEW